MQTLSGTINGQNQTFGNSLSENAIRYHKRAKLTFGNSLSENVIASSLMEMRIIIFLGQHGRHTLSQKNVSPLLL
jgi:hypothetical protein